MEKNIAIPEKPVYDDTDSVFVESEECEGCPYKDIMCDHCPEF